ncbi:MAG: hypothetical protein ACLQPD_07760, partial [Desulfomonilaceae bacterium]
MDATDEHTICLKTPTARNSFEQHIAFVQNAVRFALARFETILVHLVVSLRGMKATKQSPKLLLRGLPRADALAMTT